MPSLGDVFSLHGRADAQWQALGLQPEGDDETRRLSVDTRAWENSISPETLEDLRRRWNLESAEWKVSFKCEIQGFSGPVDPDARSAPTMVDENQEEIEDEDGWTDVAAPKSGTTRSGVYATPLRVTSTRGDWCDLAPTVTWELVPAGFERYRVRVWAEVVGATEAPLTFVNGWFENGGELVALGPNSPGKVFWPGNGIVLFVHWVGKDAPGFVTLSVRFDGECPA
jgi:hypothetical protein